VKVEIERNKKGEYREIKREKLEENNQKEKIVFKKKKNMKKNNNRDKIKNRLEIKRG